MNVLRECEINLSANQIGLLRFCNHFLINRLLAIIGNLILSLLRTGFIDKLQTHLMHAYKNIC